MKIHLIFDFMHIYYKYFFRKGLKRLSAPIDWNGTVIEKDTTLIFHPLSDIESQRRSFESQGNDVTVSVCFDSKSHRNDSEDSDYKSGREHRLSEEDIKNIDYIKERLAIAGHNTYKLDGFEADDLVNYICNKYKDQYDYTVIFTNDKDLIVNVCDNVIVMRYKSVDGGYNPVRRDNYESYLEPEFKVFIPYNALGLYLATVGDKSDHIKGINGFGPVAFKKLITKVAAKNDVNWSECGDYHKAFEVAQMCREFLTDEQYQDMLDSFALVANLKVEDGWLEAPERKSTREMREDAYGGLRMMTLIP